MLASAVPASFPIPFANAAGVGYIRVVPTASQIGVTPGAASLTDGFPPLNMTPVNAGGVPPFGQDMNGILNSTTAGLQWVQVGGRPVYNSGFSTSIGGYPNGAILQSADGTGFWRSTADNNTTNPDSGGANWLPHFFYGLANVTLTSSNVTLSAVQYAKNILFLSGTLSNNVQLIFPAGLVGTWTIINNCVMGAFVLTAITSGGTGIALTAAANATVSDGTNMYTASPTVTTNGRLLNTIRFTAQTVALTSISNGSPAVLTVTSALQLPANGSPMRLTTSGTLPTGLALATDYYVVGASGTTFNLSATKGGAALNTSSGGSGTHTMNSIYVKNAASTSIVVVGQAAGGGSGGITTAVGVASGGGASGNRFIKTIPTSSLATTETITIPAGGTAGSTAGTDGGTGGTVSFGSFASAVGGLGGKGNTSVGINVAGGASGTIGTSGDINYQGNPGGPGLCSGATSAQIGGYGGVSPNGGAGRSQTFSTDGNQAGQNAANNSGSGASGAENNTAASATGGVGGSGEVIVYEYS